MNQLENGWRIVGGTMILALGIIHLLNNFNVINIGFRANRWWPAVVIVIGIGIILAQRRTRGLVAGLFWIGTGSLFLLSTTGYLNMQISKLVWPIMLIWFGLILFLGFSGCRSSQENGG